MKKPLLLIALLCTTCLITAATQEDLEKMFSKIEANGYCKSTRPSHLNEGRERQLSFTEQHLSRFLALLGAKRYFQVNVYETKSLAFPPHPQCYRGTPEQLIEKIKEAAAQHEELRRRRAQPKEYGYGPGQRHGL